MLAVDMARSFSDDSAISYLLQVWWISAFFT